MSVKTNNIYGRIAISNRTIAKFISHVGMDCYGIVEIAPRNCLDAVFGKIKYGKDVKGVKIHSFGDRINIDMVVIVKFGVSVKAVVEALKESIKYKVERFTGMIVDVINVRVKGIKK